MEMKVVDSRDFRWEEPPAHFGGFSKCLINPETVGTTGLDFRISRYQIRGRVDRHSHAEAEQVYYVISGVGTAWSGDQRVVVSAGMALYMPPGVDHEIENTGDEDLVFAVITTQPPSAEA